jgi:hypothetical protein
VVGDEGIRSGGKRRGGRRCLCRVHGGVPGEHRRHLALSVGGGLKRSRRERHSTLEKIVRPEDGG